MATTDLPILAAAYEAASDLGLRLDGEVLIDAAGEPWTMHEFSAVVAARLGYEAQPLPEPVQAAARPNRALQKAMAKLTQLRASLGNRLMAASEHAYEEALRRAGVKVGARARSRGTTKAVQSAARTAVAAGEGFGPLLAALGLKEADLLAGAFSTYETQVRAMFAAQLARQHAIVRSFGIDPLSVLPDDRASTDAASYLVAGLIALARQRLLGKRENTAGSSDLPGEVTGSIPARLILSAIAINEGQVRHIPGRTPDDIPTLARIGAVIDQLGMGLDDALSGSLSLEVALAQVVLERTPTIEWEWVHGFYGEPTTEFDPHARLDGEVFTDRNTDPRLISDTDWPPFDVYFPRDHDTCTCEWIALIPEEEPESEDEAPSLF
jgi:hypothetical protein